jgi:hypothetical protein
MAKNMETTQSLSDFNLEKLSTKELSDHIDAVMQFGGNLTVVGNRGSGKTSIAKERINKAGMKEVYMNLSVMERVDFGGYPRVMGETGKYLSYIMPAIFEPMFDGDQKVVVLLDEVDKADPSLWAPLLEFTQFRSLNGIKLKNVQACIMTGNLISEGGSRPSLPLLDRAEKYLLQADATSWLDWGARTGNIHPSVTAYLTDNPKDLFGSPDPGDLYADPSPRGWHGASDLIKYGESKGWSSELINKKVCGRVGKNAGLKYSMYFEHYMQLLPLVEDVYHGKDVSAKYKALEPTKQLVACMIVGQRLASQLDAAKDGDLPNSVKLVGKFLQKVAYENVLVSVRNTIQIDRLVRYNLDEHDDWKDVISKINKAIGA